MDGKFERMASGQVEIRVGRPDGATETHIHPPDCDFEFSADLPGDYHIACGGKVFTINVGLGAHDGVTVKVSKSEFGEVVTMHEVTDDLRTKMIEHVLSLKDASLEALGISVVLSQTLGHDWCKLVDSDIRDEILSFAGFRGATCSLHGRPETHGRTRKAILEHMEKTPALPSPYRGFRLGIVQAPIASPYPGKSIQWHSHERLDHPESESKPKHTDAELRAFVFGMNSERLDDLSSGCGWGERPAGLSDADFLNLILVKAGLAPSIGDVYSFGEQPDRRRAQLCEALDYWTNICKSKPKHTDGELKAYVISLDHDELDELSERCGWGSRPIGYSNAQFAHVILANAGVSPVWGDTYNGGELVDHRRIQLSECLAMSQARSSGGLHITSRTGPSIANAMAECPGGGSDGSIPWTHGFGMVGRDGPKIYGLVTPEEAKAEAENKRMQMTASQNMHINVLGRKDATPIVRDEFSFTAPDGSGERFTFYDDGDISVSKRGMESLHVKFEAWRKKADEANAQCERLQASGEAMCFAGDRLVAENAKLMEDNAMLRRALYGNGKARVTVDNGWDD